MKKMGIYIACAPEQSMGEHGIGRLIAFLLSGLLKADDLSITIAIPEWFRKDLTAFLADQRIDTRNIKVIATRGIPFVLRIRSFFINCFKKRPGVKRYPFLKRSLRFVAKTYFQLFVKWLSMSSTLMSICFGILILPLIIVSLPFVLLGAILFGIKYSIDKAKHAVEDSDRFKKYALLVKKSFVLKPLRQYKNNFVARSIFEELRKHEVKKLIKKINKCNDIPVWLVPALIWPEIGAIKARKIVAAPDIIFMDFATRFSDRATLAAYKKIKQTIAIADHFICYSNHVKQKHLVEPFLVEPAKVSVIKHAPVNLRSYLTIEDADSQELTKCKALQILTEYQKAFLQENTYLRNYDFSGTRFIFYSSQVRPYKNFMSLIKSYEILLRKRYVNIKLIVTGDIYNDEELKNYILQRRLQLDILSFTKIPSAVLAALNHLAICAVNPTLFEGGFPFTFTEAYSVGTPSIMSHIPVIVDEVDQEELKERMLFDPYDLNDMADKIEWGVRNHERLYDLQASLYKRLQQRTWDNVAMEYLQLFQLQEQFGPEARNEVKTKDAKTVPQVELAS